MTISDPRQLCLKRLYGGVLTEAETENLDAFLATDEGARYEATSQEMKNMLQNFAKVDITPETEAAMIDRVERMLQTEAKKQHRGVTWLVATMFCMLALVLSISAMKNSWNGGTFYILGLLCVFLVLVFLAWRSNKRLIRNPDVRGRLRRVQKARANRKPVLGFLVWLLVWGMIVTIPVEIWVQADGTLDAILSISVWFFIWCVAVGLYRWKRYSLRREDPEAWDWWNEKFNEN